MFLAMDSTSKIFTANRPYPNLECTVNFKCDYSDGWISSDIVVVSCDPWNSWPQGTNTWIVSSLATSDMDIWSS